MKVKKVIGTPILDIADTESTQTVINKIIRNERNLYAQILEIIKFLENTYFKEGSTDNFDSKPINGKVSSVTISNGKLIVSYYLDGAIHDVTYLLDITKDGGSSGGDTIEYITNVSMGICRLTQMSYNEETEPLEDGDEGDFAYKEGIIFTWSVEDDEWQVVEEPEKYYVFEGDLYEFDKTDGSITKILEGNKDAKPSIVKLKYYVPNSSPDNRHMTGNEVGDYGFFMDGIYQWDGQVWKSINIGKTLMVAQGNIYEWTSDGMTPVITGNITPDTSGFVPRDVYDAKIDTLEQTDIYLQSKIAEYSEIKATLEATKRAFDYEENHKVNFDIAQIESKKSLYKVTPVIPSNIVTVNEILSNTFSTANRLYVINTICTIAQDITIAEGCVLQFGLYGKIETYNNTRCKIIGTGTTVIVNNDHAVFGRDVIISGTWNNNYAKAVWFDAKGYDEFEFLDWPLICYNDNIATSNDTYLSIDNNNLADITVEEPAESFHMNEVFGAPMGSGSTRILSNKYIFYSEEYECFLLQRGDGLYTAYWNNSNLWNTPDENDVYDSTNKLHTKLPKGIDEVVKIATNLYDYDGSLHCIKRIIPAGEDICFDRTLYTNSDIELTDIVVKFKQKVNNVTTTLTKVISSKTIEAGASVRTIVDSTETISNRGNQPVLRFIVEQQNLLDLNDVTVDGVVPTTGLNREINQNRFVEIDSSKIENFNIKGDNDEIIVSDLKLNHRSVDVILPRCLLGKTNYIQRFYNNDPQYPNSNRYKLSRLYTSNDVFYDTTTNKFFVRDGFDYINKGTEDEPFYVFKYYSYWLNSDEYNYRFINDKGFLKVTPVENKLYTNTVIKKLDAIEYFDPVPNQDENNVIRDLKYYSDDTLKSIYDVAFTHYGDSNYDTLPLRNALRLGNCNVDLEADKKYFIYSGISPGLISTSSSTSGGVTSYTYTELNSSIDNEKGRIFYNKNNFVFNGNNSTIYFLPRNGYSTPKFFNDMSNLAATTTNGYTYSDVSTSSSEELVSAKGKYKYGWWYNTVGNGGRSDEETSIISVKKCDNSVIKNLNIKSLHCRNGYGRGEGVASFYNRNGGQWMMSSSSSRYKSFSVNRCNNFYIQNCVITNPESFVSTDYDKDTSADVVPPLTLYLDKIIVEDVRMGFVPKGIKNILISSLYIKQKDYIGGDGTHIVYGQDRLVENMTWYNCAIVSGIYTNGSQIDWHNKGGYKDAIYLTFDKCLFVGTPDIGTSNQVSSPYTTKGTLSFNNCFFDVFDTPSVGSKETILIPKFIRGDKAANINFVNCNIHTTLPIVGRDSTFIERNGNNRYPYIKISNCTINAKLNNQYLVYYKTGTAIFKNNNISIDNGNVLYLGLMRNYDRVIFDNNNIVTYDTVFATYDSVTTSTEVGDYTLSVKDNTVYFNSVDEQTNKLFVRQYTSSSLTTETEFFVPTRHLFENNSLISTLTKREKDTSSTNYATGGVIDFIRLTDKENLITYGDNVAVVYSSNDNAELVRTPLVVSQ